MLETSTSEYAAIPSLLAKREVMSALRVSLSGVNRMIARGDVVARKIGGRTLIEADSVRRLIERAPIVNYRA